MKYGCLILEKKEYVYLKRILNVSSYADDFQTQKSLQKLNDELKEARIVDEADMPSDIIRFNSVVQVSSHQGWERTLQLVIPAESDFKQNKVSLLTPMGSALIGYSKGDTIVWDFPGGVQNLLIEEVTQEKTAKALEFIL
ncbi:GreA/GreB family elongation factor [Tamlana sp. 2_MG-2023]|uniref:GreA/GreB family elongation factor n=1 Tax=unclassified Tamlana TaxID=2614803 RepID=UPI0026E386F4|nr:MULTISPECIES: GreA/GreB family elongation factor [unclassified Tamlana]MDO6759251.1 GreA/GreB family elongation factor [Tamlana sp. 2_MG-2023]MDO6790610.1 GreA/GreB family elongation factor [Tamlana sp. 1_MG-2023]